MAKDTEKLIRQLSLISFLMAERRPVSALEIKQDVEGYSEMNDDAFARRFYADRAELEALGINLKVEKPPEGYFEAELYTLPPENFYLPPIEFSDGELAALQTSLALLDGRFAYAEPLRLALQQLSWGRPSPLGSGDQRQVAVAVTASAGGRELSAAAGEGRDRDLAPQDDRVRVLLDRARRAAPSARSTPTTCSTRAASSTSSATRTSATTCASSGSRASRDKVSYATKAEHDFTTPEDFDPWAYAQRADWQLGEPDGDRAGVDLGADRVARRARLRPPRQLRAGHAESGNQWRAGSRRVPGPGRRLHDRVRAAAPAGLVGAGPRRARAAARARRAGRRGRRAARRRSSSATPTRSPTSSPSRRARRARRGRSGRRTATRRPGRNGHGETPIRPERFARLVALAGILIQAGREGAQARTSPRCASASRSPSEELREDLDVLNVVNFGGGSYVLYAEVQGDEIEVDPEPYSDNFARPARLLPLEAKALVAAIDLLGDHLPEGSLASARQKIVTALGEDPSQEGLQIAPSAADDAGRCRARSTARSSSRACSRSSTTRRTRTSSPSARSSPTR